MTNEWDNLLQLIKDLWTQFPINKNDLLHPTSSLVVKFYSSFILELNEKVQFLAGSYYNPIEFNEHLETEDRLFLTMYYIFNTFEKLKFMLCDIYEPAPIRTKNFFKISCHLLSFAETILDEAESLASHILKMKENTNKLEDEHEEILSEIHQKATRKSELIETKEKMFLQFSEVKHAHEQMKDNREQQEVVYLKKRKEIEMLKQQMQQEEQELRQLDQREKDLTEQFVGEAEYKNLLNIVENLKNENQLLDTDRINMEDLLSHENDVLQHYQDCKKRIPDIEDFDSEIVKTVIELEEELKDFQIEREALINDKINPLTLVKTQNESRVLEKKQSLEKLSKNCEEIMERKLKDEKECLQKIAKIKEKLKSNINYNNGTIKNLIQEIEQLVKNNSDLRTIFQKEYIKIAEADAKAKKHLISMLHNINNLQHEELRLKN